METFATTAGRLQSVSGGEALVTYNYVANSPLVSEIVTEGTDKKGVQPLYFYDEQDYEVGADLNGATDFCSKFDELLKKTPTAVYEGRKDGGYNDLSTCRACDEKSKVTNHGGSEGQRRMP